MLFYFNILIFQAFPLCIFLTSLQLAAGALVAIPLKKEGFIFFKLHFLFDEIALIYLYLFSLQPLKWVLEEEVVPD